MLSLSFCVLPSFYATFRAKIPAVEIRNQFYRRIVSRRRQQISAFYFMSQYRNSSSRQERWNTDDYNVFLVVLVLAVSMKGVGTTNPVGFSQFFGCSRPCAVLDAHHVYHEEYKLQEWVLPCPIKLHPYSQTAIAICFLGFGFRAYSRHVTEPLSTIKKSLTSVKGYCRKFYYGFNYNIFPSKITTEVVFQYQ